MAKTLKLTPSLLRKIVLEERARFLREAAGEDHFLTGDDSPEDVEAAETDAADYADTLAHDIDYMKALKIHEQRLQAKLKRIQEAKAKVRRRVTRKLG
jgi:hypothetical protein